MSKLLLGCIADDFTGATDLANNLVREGMRTHPDDRRSLAEPAHNSRSGCRSPQIEDDCRAVMQSLSRLLHCIG